MAHALPRSSFSGSSLIRFLSDLDIADIAASKQTIAETISQWLDWTDAIALSAALNGAQNRGQTAGRLPATTAANPAAEAAITAVTQLRGELTASIQTDMAAAQGEAALTSLRRQYVAWQRTLENRIGSLRAEVRAALSDCSAELGRLAALDAVFEKALGARERHLLGTVPALLEQRFAHVRKAQLQEVAETPQPHTSKPPPQYPAWWVTYCRDMQAILLAELEIRLQPIEGMLDTLRRVAPSGHE